MTLKLTKRDWLAHSLKELAQNGHEQLTANKLASKLGVSRGSFYWHFKDVLEFEASLMEHWAETLTDGVIKDLEPLASPILRLSTLMKRSMDGNMKLERAVRSWAVSDKFVAEAVKSIDARRVEYIEDLLQAMNVASGDIRPRAQVLYWASVGRVMMPEEDIDKLSSAQLDRLAELLTS
jgi:AcrR family transcriptional regulator